MFRLSLQCLLSLPTRGAWIEIGLNFARKIRFVVAPHAGSVDRNALGGWGRGPQGWSLPTRGAWIEISSSRCSRGVLRVAPHAGSVDRNCRKNRQAVRPHPVAPHAGSVDRNFFSSSVGSCRFVSLPTRGAWIEILDGSRTARRALTVAPHAGSVDRNLSTLPRKAVKTRVAPHAGSVDRNVPFNVIRPAIDGRSPRGERG